MKKILNLDSPAGVKDIMQLIVRIGIPLMLIANHGYPKLMKLFSGDNIQFMNVFGMGETTSFVLVTISEFFCASLVIIGLFTRGAAVVLTIQFLILVFHIHWADALAIKELPIIYLVTFTYFLFMGPGKYSLDYLLHKKFYPTKSLVAG